MTYYSPFDCYNSLSDILGLVVSEKNDTEVIIEFREWRPTQYFIQDRDSFIGSLNDVMGLAKGTQFSVRLEHFFPHTLPDRPLPLYQVLSFRLFFCFVIWVS